MADFISPRDYGAQFDGNYDDASAWRQAFAAAAASGRPRSVIFDGAVSLIDGQNLTPTFTRLDIPPGVTLYSPSTFEGGDAIAPGTTSLPVMVFRRAINGITMGHESAISGVCLYGAGGFPNITPATAVVDHLIEFAGKASLTNVRLNCGIDGARIWSSLTSIAGIVITNRSSGLVDGTYNMISFTGGPAGGAGRLVITVVGNKIGSVGIALGGPGYSPYFPFGLAANALYAGSPAIPTVGYIATAQMGRSRFHNVFIMATPSTNIGLEVDGAFDFVDIDDVEIWSPNGIGGTSQVGLRIGRVDGLSLKGYKCFGMYTGLLMNQPSDDVAHPFGDITAVHLDAVAYGINVTGPEQQLAITGGYIRAVNRGITVANPYAGVSVSAMTILTQNDMGVQLVNFSTGAITGNVFTSDSLYSASVTFPYVYISGTNYGYGVGLGSYIVQGNTSDGRHPFITCDGNAIGGTVGPNNWPGKKYSVSGSPGYFNSPNPAVNKCLPTTGGSVVFTASATDYVINHNLGNVPSMPSIELIGAAAASVNRAIIVGLGADTMTIRIINGATGATVTSGSFQVIWQA